MIYGFVVEGLHDKDLLEQNFANVKAFHCNGSRFTNREKRGIEDLQSSCNQTFLLFDPDPEGDRFTQEVQSTYPLPSLRISPFECQSIRGNRIKTGIEHASVDYLLRFFRQNGLSVVLTSAKIQVPYGEEN